jgi:hypothetical protein
VQRSAHPKQWASRCDVAAIRSRPPRRLPAAIPADNKEESTMFYQVTETERMHKLASIFASFTNPIIAMIVLQYILAYLP